MSSGLTPTLARVIQEAIEARLATVQTSIPARVTRVDVTKAQVDVQPVLKAITGDEMPVITNVPIAFYRAGSAAVYLPVKVGHTVMLQFSSRSMDLWLTQGGTVDPDDPRQFDLSDAVAYPGVYPFTEEDAPSDQVSPDNIVIINDEMKIELSEDEILLENGDRQILLTAEEILLENEQCSMSITNELITLQNDEANLLIKPDALELYGNGDAIALASKVMTALNTIQDTFDNHTHGYMDNTGSPPVPTPSTTDPPGSTIGTLDDVASEKVKAE